MTISDAAHLFALALLVAALIAAAIAWHTDTAHLDPIGPDSVTRLLALNQPVEPPGPAPYDWAREETR